MTFESKPKKLIIIGAGISGLSAGIFGEKNGFTTEIFEKNPVPGGLCVCWNRKGFKIDGCIHWLTGTKHGSSLRALWDNLEAFEDDQIIRSDNFGTIEFNGKSITFWTDLDKLENELLEISPIDKRRIRQTIKFIKKFQNMHLPVEVPLSLMTGRDLLGVAKDMITFLPSYLYCTNIMLSDYAKKFKSALIRTAFTQMIPNDVNLYAALYAFGTVASGNGGVLKGGSTTLINNLVDSYERKGGFIHYNSEVQNIIIKDGVAKGIRLKNGTEYFADYVISANDPFNTMTLLPTNEKFTFFSDHLGDDNKYPIPSCILLAYAIDKESYDSLNLTKTFQFTTRPFLVGEKYQDTIRLRDYSYDECFIKDGKTVVQVMIPQLDSDYSFWNNIKDKAQYNKEKLILANAVIDEIVRKFPQLLGKIEILDTCTHKTFERYVHSYHGSFQPFILTAKGKMLNHNGKIGNVKNLLLASQWGITPGGIPIAMLSGKFAIQRTLKAERKNYRITKKLHYKFY